MSRELEEAMRTSVAGGNELENGGGGDVTVDARDEHGGRRGGSHGANKDVCRLQVSEAKLQ
jgi:hypothetical protein